MKQLLIRPLITEKTMTLVQGGWYTFMAPDTTSKQDARIAVERMYGVTVTDVRSITMPGKLRRAGRRGTPIQHSDWKKIMVKLKEGQTIDAFQIGSGTEEQQQG